MTNRRFLTTLLLLTAFLPSALAESPTTFKHIPVQYIVALGDPSANAGSGAQSWGLWRQDPGPRGCLLKDYAQLKTTGVAPAQWKFDSTDWWLEEHGAIMEKPVFPQRALLIQQTTRPQVAAQSAQSLA